MTDRFVLDGNLTVEDVPEVRRFVEKLQSRRESEDDVSRVAMATHELLENAIKFSSDGSTSLCVEVGGSKITITTRNRAKPADVAELQQIAKDLASTLDPMLYYLEQMRRTPMKAGGLGLGRVAAEGEMQIELVLDGDTVQVRAEAMLTPRKT
jgi:hypothetical protein